MKSNGTHPLCNSLRNSIRPRQTHYLMRSPSLHQTNSQHAYLHENAKVGLRMWDDIFQKLIYCREKSTGQFDFNYTRQEILRDWREKLSSLKN